MEEKGQILDIEDVVLHPQYEQQAYQDIAVVKLKTSKCKFTSMLDVKSFANARQILSKCPENAQQKGHSITM